MDTTVIAIKVETLLASSGSSSDSNNNNDSGAVAIAFEQKQIAAFNERHVHQACALLLFVYSAVDLADGLLTWLTVFMQQI